MIDRRKAATRKLPMSSPTVERSDFIIKRIYCIVLAFVMMFSMTAMAVEAEPVCTGECDHTHEEASVLRWECSNHNLAPYYEKEIGNSEGAQGHKYRITSGDYCTNSGCDYKWVTTTAWKIEQHTYSGNMCIYCGYYR